jgi:hypothetical protein
METEDEAQVYLQCQSNTLGHAGRQTCNPKPFASGPPSSLGTVHATCGSWHVRSPLDKAIQFVRFLLEYDKLEHRGACLRSLCLGVPHNSFRASWQSGTTSSQGALTESPQALGTVASTQQGPSNSQLGTWCPAQLRSKQRLLQLEQSVC